MRQKIVLTFRKRRQSGDARDQGCVELSAVHYDPPPFLRDLEEMVLDQYRYAAPRMKADEDPELGASVFVPLPEDRSGEISGPIEETDQEGVGG